MKDRSGMSLSYLQRQAQFFESKAAGYRMAAQVMRDQSLNLECSAKEADDTAAEIQTEIARRATEPTPDPGAVPEPVLAEPT